MPLLLEIVTPEGQLYADEVDAVNCPGIVGELGVLPHHAPLLSTLGIGELRIRKGDQEESFVIAGGFLAMLLLSAAFTFWLPNVGAEPGP